MSRHEAREMSFQLLYQLDLQPGDREWQIDDFISHAGDLQAALTHESEQDDEETSIDTEGDPSLSREDHAYIRRTVEGTIARAAELDDVYGKYLREWSSSRIPAVDRAILRLATFEILYEPDVPYKVAINEAVRIAKRYASPDSRQYINAVLGRIERPAAAGDSGEDEGVDGQA